MHAPTHTHTHTHTYTHTQDATIRIWDVFLCKTTMVLSGHTHCVTCVKWGGEGLLYTASQDRTIKVWRAKDVSCHGNHSYHGENILVSKVTWPLVPRLHPAGFCQWLFLFAMERPGNEAFLLSFICPPRMHTIPHLTRVCYVGLCKAMATG